MPALTLQPLVENAIRYGVMPRPEGGTVCIRTRVRNNEVLLCVEDGGVGFDPNAPRDDNRSHVGIVNTRARLQALCDGRLEIDSRPGEGTCVTVRIPLQAASDAS